MNFYNGLQRRYSPVNSLFQNPVLSLPQKVTITKSTVPGINHSEHSNLSGAFDKIVTASQKLGVRILIEAPAGAGKTWSVCDIAEQWASLFTEDSPKLESSMLHEFDFVYYIPVRRIQNHTENIERIICHDLNMVPGSLEGDVRRQIKGNSEHILFLIDECDEIGIRENKHKTIKEIIMGIIAPKATVIVTSRPYCALKIKAHCKKNQHVIIKLQECQSGIIEYYLKNNCLFAAPTNQLRGNFMMRHLVKKTLFRSILSGIHHNNETENVENTSSAYTCSTETRMLDALWGILIGIKEQKEGISDKITFYQSFRDEKLSSEVRRLIQTLASEAYSMITTGRLELKETPTLSLDELGSLGVIDRTAENICQFYHKSFLEHCAAYHLIHNEHLITEFDSNTSHRSEEHGCHENVIKYAVGMKPNLLNEIASNLSAPLQLVTMESHCDLDLSCHEGLLSECEDDLFRKMYIDSMLSLQVTTNPSCGNEKRGIQARSANIIRCIGGDKCLFLLKSANPELIRSSGSKTVINVPDNRAYEFAVASPMMLASLFMMDINMILPLTLYSVNQDVLPITREWKVTIHEFQLWE